jgi:hypothetical protein
MDYEVINRRKSLYQFVPDWTTEFFGLDLNKVDHDARGQSQSEG